MSKYTPEQHMKAYELYVSSNLSQAEIAKQTGVNKATLTQWIDKEGWSSKKKSLVKTGMNAIDDTFTQFLQENKLDVAQKQLGASMDLLEEAHKKFRKRPDGTVPYMAPNDMLKLSQVIKNMTDASARVVGLDRPSPSELPAGGISKGPLILVGLQAQPVQAPAKPEPKTITIEEDPF